MTTPRGASLALRRKPGSAAHQQVDAAIRKSAEEETPADGEMGCTGGRYSNRGTPIPSGDGAATVNLAVQEAGAANAGNRAAIGQAGMCMLGHGHGHS